MFGYVKPVPDELLVREYEFYKCTYCGICRSLKRHTGFFSNINLSYDSVFLALVRMVYIPDCEFCRKKCRCIAHPLKKKPMLSDNSATEYTARAFSLLTYHKLRDDIADEKFIKRLLVRLMLPIFSRARKKAKMPELDAIMAKKLSEIRELEAARCESVDEPAMLFGELLGEVFSHGMDGECKDTLYECGYHLGKFIYAADAAEDYEKDAESGAYNPYVIAYGGAPLTRENRSNIRAALLTFCQGIESAVNKMPFGNRSTLEEIIKNVIYLGLVKRIAFLENVSSEKTEEKETRK